MPFLLLAINQIVRNNSQFNIQTGLKEFGMDVSRLITPFGTLVLKTHPLFNQITGGTTGGSKGAAGVGVVALFVMAMLPPQNPSRSAGDPLV